ncbi:MAG: DUF4115 domain-containing protein [Gallionella sp.]|nr:DUF4115 domain-containing protein [Gallionella sp.]
MTETSSGLENNPAVMPAASLGKMLREARERLGLSVMDVSSQIKFAPRQIEALEADDFRHLPETAFLRGFVRSYAKILHLDAQLLLAALPQKKSAVSELTPDSVEEPFPDIHSVLRHNVIWLGAALLLILVGAGFALWHFTTPPEPVKAAQVEVPVSLPAEASVNRPQSISEAVVIEPVLPKIQPSAALAQSSVPAANTLSSRAAMKKQATKPATQPDTQPSAQPGTEPDLRSGAQPNIQPDAQPSAQPDFSTPITSLHLVFNEESWAEIKDKNGKILSSRVHPAGTEMRVNGRAPFAIVISRASTVSLYHQGKQVDLVPYIKGKNQIARFTLD